MSDIKKGQIIGRILVSGQLETCSPLMISQGDGMDTDIDIVLDGEGKPFIPGTSWTGAIRDHFSDIDTKLLNMFFGDADNYQSAFISQDLFIVGDAKKEIRTNTKIEAISQTAEEQSLHNYEALSAGNLFDFGFEVMLREVHKSKKKDIVKLVKTIIHELQNEFVTLGAKTNSGFGKVKLVNVKYKELAFPEDSEWWFLSDRNPTDSVIINDSEIFPISSFNAEITGNFLLDGSILVRQDYTGDDENIDAEQTTSNDKPIIPGTSLKGVIRHRAEKILKTMMDKSSAEVKIKDLFGWVDNKTKSDAIKGRIAVGECVINGGILKKQTRIKVDMFTGGAMDGALFSELPLWGDGNTTIDVDIKIKDAHKFDIALILQVMKDLWTGNLSIGGEASIGRGRFEGQKLTMTFGKKSASLTQVDRGILIEDKDALIPMIESAWKKETLTSQEETA